MGKKDNPFDRIDDKIPESVRNLLETGGNLITIIVPVGGLIGSIVSWCVGDASTSITWKDYAIIALAIIAIVAFTRILKLKSENKRSIETIENKHQIEIQNLFERYQKERSIVSQNYYRLILDYRNIINEMEYSYKNGSLTDKHLTVMVTSFLENALEYLIETLQQMSGQDICGCVKAIIGGNCNRISYEEARVKTFVRSHNTEAARKDLDQQDEEGVRLRDNTDFMDIVAEDRNKNDSVFYQPNLKKYEVELKKIGKTYNNSTPHWENYYIGTIVAPIRIASKRLFYLNNRSSKRKPKNRKKHSVYYTLGFLCVDSLSEDAFSWDQKDNYTYIVKAYAAAMFNILSKNQFYLKRLHDRTRTANENVKCANTNQIRK